MVKRPEQNNQEIEKSKSKKIRVKVKKQ